MFNLRYNSFYVLFIRVFDRFNIKEVQLECGEDYEYFNLFEAEDKNFIIVNNKQDEFDFEENNSELV